MIKVVNNCDVEGNLYGFDIISQELIRDEDLVKAYYYHNNSGIPVLAVEFRRGDRITTWHELSTRSELQHGIFFERLFQRDRYVNFDSNAE